MNVFVDRGYRTGLGTGFYDRLAELHLLGELVDAVRTVVVYGPRGVGKSELVRYFTVRRFGRGAVVVDARRGVVEQLGLAVDQGELLRSLAELVERAADLPGGLVGVLEHLASMLRRRSLIVLDELHLLYGDVREALRVLEAAAGYLAKSPGGGARLVVTVSEGFFATLEALHKLHGYSVSYLLVEPMPLDAFKNLYDEYSARHECRVGFDVIVGLAGPTPGYLPDLCPRSRLLLDEWLRLELQRLWAAVREAAEAAGLPEDEARRVAAELLAGRVPRNAREERLAERLVEANIAYPCLTHPRSYRPQLPVYLAALQAGPDAADLETLLEHSRIMRCAEEAG